MELEDNDDHGRYGIPTKPATASCATSSRLRPAPLARPRHDRRLRPRDPRPPTTPRGTRRL